MAGAQLGRALAGGGGGAQPADLQPAAAGAPPGRDCRCCGRVHKPGWLAGIPGTKKSQLAPTKAAAAALGLGLLECVAYQPMLCPCLQTTC